MTSLLCNSCNSLEISSMIETHDVGVLIIGVPENFNFGGEREQGEDSYERCNRESY